MNKRTSQYAFCTSLFILLLHSAYIFLSFFRIPLNSDHASQVLQAADILNGNILLRGWNLTGVSFYLSELPFYVIGTAVRGVDTFAYIIAAAAMVICLSMTGYRAAFKDHHSASLEKTLLYLGLTGIPTLSWLGYLRGHCAIFIYFFLLLIITNRILRSDETSGGQLLCFGILTACGCMSDMQLLIIGIIPIILFCGTDLLRNEHRFDKEKSVWILGTAAAGTGTGMVMDSFLMKLGGINKNAFLDTRKFVNMDALGEKILLLGKGILTVFRADFSASGPTLRETGSLITAAVIILITVILIFKTLRSYLKEGSGDSVSIILSFSLLLMVIICFFTDIYTSEDSARYIAYMPFAAGVLICRELESRARQLKAGFCVPVFLLVLILFFQPPVFHRIETPQDRLAVFLQQNGLSDGYADFWNASHTTVAANGNVRVRAIRGRVPELGRPESLEMQNWFCKTEWYQTSPHNFIVFDGSGYLHISEDVVTALLGAPDRILETDEYRIFLYDRDLTKEISVNG